MCGNYKIKNLNAGFGGSTPDSFIWVNCKVKKHFGYIASIRERALLLRKFQYNEFCFSAVTTMTEVIYIVYCSISGDTGYPLRSNTPDLIIPVGGPAEYSPKATFNKIKNNYSQPININREMALSIGRKGSRSLCK